MHTILKSKILISWEDALSPLMLSFHVKVLTVSTSHSLTPSLLRSLVKSNRDTASSGTSLYSVDIGLPTSSSTVYWDLPEAGGSRWDSLLQHCQGEGVSVPYPGNQLSHSALFSSYTVSLTHVTHFGFQERPFHLTSQFAQNPIGNHGCYSFNPQISSSTLYFANTCKWVISPSLSFNWDCRFSIMLDPAPILTASYRLLPFADTDIGPNEWSWDSSC